jgi:hypothetical protein
METIKSLHFLCLYEIYKVQSTCTELLGLFWTLSIVLYVEDKKSHNVSETGSVSVLRWMGPLERSSLNHCPAGAIDFSLLHSVQTASGPHSGSYPMATVGYFPGDKATGG